MKTEFEYKGYWYLPDDPENSVAGILKFIPNEKSRLELIGGFEGPQYSLLKNRKVEVIHGETSDSKKITLLGCHRSGSYNFSCSFPLTNYSVEIIIEGIILNTIEDRKFNAIQIQLPLLNEWINHSNINVQIGYLNDKPNDITLHYSNSQVEDLKVSLDDSTELSLNFGCNPSIDDVSCKSLEQTTVCKIQAISSEDFASLLYKVSLFKSFLELATKSSLNYGFIKLYSEEVFQELKTGDHLNIPINVYFKEFTEERLQAPSRILFTHDKIKASFSEILKKWYTIDDTFSPLRNHLIQSITPSSTFTSGNFLIVIQALDGFYRRFRNNEERVFRRRIESLAAEFVDIESLQLSEGEIKQAIDSRDYYSHFFPKSEKENILDGFELFDLTKKLRILLTCCVLKEIGFDLMSIDELNLAALD